MAPCTTRTVSTFRALMKHREETGSITEFSGGEDMGRDEALFLEM